MAADTLDITLSTIYQLLTAGPAVITLKTGGTAELRFAAGGVPASNLPGHILRRGGIEGFNYTGTLNIYAKTDASPDKAVVLTFTE